MESHEVLKNSFESTSPKAIAAELGVSLSLVYKWAQEQSETGSGSRNPLDRLLEIIRLTGDLRVVEWLCQKCDGYFVRNPDSNCQEGFEVLPATSEIVDQFSKLLHRISESALDHSITPDEAETIRHSWDKLKCYAEGFVRCCEEGDFEAIQEAEKIEEGKKKTLY
ncbi:MAG: helix-turn-helix domain-containing protein [Akkermansiaceae bacterium]|nr:helix-turn-helix domain-containing protein [Akkermansiaceae bacterium]